MDRRTGPRSRKGRIYVWPLLLAMAAALLAGCAEGRGDGPAEGGQMADGKAITDAQDSADAPDMSDAQGMTDARDTSGAPEGTDDGPDAGDGGGGSAIDRETGKDGQVDIAALQAENPDIFAWICIPDTDIDYPILQSEEADDYYECHDAHGDADDGGAIYTELANLKDMCDFNTVIHGRTSEDGEEGPFAGLYRFADPDYFASHAYAYIYLEGNVLTYEIFAAYEREDTSLIRTYDFTYRTGCQQFLDDLYDTRRMWMNIREGWEEERVTPYHFLITLTTKKGADAQEQFVVVAALVDDAAGTIDRYVE